MSLVLINEPQKEPLTLDEVKTHLRIDGTDEDDYLNALIQVAREYCESPGTNRAFFTQTWELWLDKWPEKNHIKLPRPPLQSVNNIKYYSDDTEYTFESNNYFVDTKNEPGRIVLAYRKRWPDVTLRTANSIIIEFDAGYETIEKIPQAIKHAMLMLIGHWYENRESTISGTILRNIPFAVDALLRPYRIDPRVVMII